MNFYSIDDISDACIMHMNSHAGFSKEVKHPTTSRKMSHYPLFWTSKTLKLNSNFHEK